MTAKMTLLSFLLIAISYSAQAAPTNEVVQKILQQGVPADALDRMIRFMDDFKGRSFNQDTYICAGADPASVTPCEESKRTRSNKTITLGSPQQVAIIDYQAASTDFRFFLINLKNGEVLRNYSAHGVGSGKGNFAFKFSNIKDSKQTSLGIYFVGETYRGRYGSTLRMYGLQGANDQAYNRDIVLHSAWYVGDEFINSIDPKTGLKYGRLGVSWGCPAVSPSLIQKMIQSLGGGGLVMHYYGSLMDEAMSGKEVVGTAR